MSHIDISYTVDSTGAFSVEWVATTDVSTCSVLLNMASEKVPQKIGNKNFWPFCSHFGRIPRGLFTYNVRTLFLYVRRKNMFPAVKFTVPIFSFSSFHETLELRKQKCRSYSVNGPVGHPYNRAFCYRLPLLYKVFKSLLMSLLFINFSRSLFTSYSIIMCN